MSTQHSRYAPRQRSTLAAQITFGNFRLIQRLFARVDRILHVNQPRQVTTEVVEAAREGPVMGPPAKAAAV